MNLNRKEEQTREPDRLRIDLGEVTAITLASKLGTVTHFSPLLRKLAKHGLESPEEMAACAVHRGCSHYANMPIWKGLQPFPASEISNEELAIGLLSPCHPYEPLFIRVGSQLLSAPQSNPETLVRLATMERCLATLKYIASCGKETEPDNPFWDAILENFPTSQHPQPEFPKSRIHISRFRAETGITNPFKPNSPKTAWLRPQPTGMCNSNAQAHDKSAMVTANRFPWRPVRENDAPTNGGSFHHLTLSGSPSARRRKNQNPRAYLLSSLVGWIQFPTPHSIG